MREFNGKMRELHPRDLNRKLKPRMMCSSVTLPSQYQAYAVCVEFAKEWFLDKFNGKFFNSVFVDGKHSFDEFKKFSTIDEQLIRTNPVLAIIPTINVEHNRDWIDSAPEIPMMLRRTKMEGTFFNDLADSRRLHLQLMFKTILMNFVFKMRVNTRAEQLDLLEFVKLKHRAGWTETKDIALDIHVPKEIMAQIAYDAGFCVDDNLNVKNTFHFLEYLNSHSYIPFTYKLRCANGNNEYFIKVPNCVAHIKAELPSMDDGERQDAVSVNYTIDFGVEIEMTAPYAYTYYSQKEQPYINQKPINLNGAIAVMKAMKTELPPFDEHHWDLFSTTEYVVEESDIGKEIEIDFGEFFEGTDLKEVIQYTKNTYINPAMFINFKFFNDGFERRYEMDWARMKCRIIGPIQNITTVIGIYCDMGYINDTLIQIKAIGKQRID